jgi:glycosyltransferase involved in cell wall biosynthesis
VNPTLGIELLLLTWNRLEYTKVALRCLKDNTNWDLVSRLVIYDDGSEDGTVDWVREYANTFPVPAFDLREIHFGAPAATMNDFLATCEAPLFAKIDNDIAVPPGWLDVMNDVMMRYGDLELLGMEYGQTLPGPPADGEEYKAMPCRHIGGVGLMRTAGFFSRPPIGSRGRSGFTEWQHRYQPRRAWVTPDLPVVHLDRLRHRRWKRLAEEYIEKGWSRDWGSYDYAVKHWDWLEEAK